MSSACQKAAHDSQEKRASPGTHVPLVVPTRLNATIPGSADSAVVGYGGPKVVVVNEPAATGVLGLMIAWPRSMCCMRCLCWECPAPRCRVTYW